MQISAVVAGQFPVADGQTFRVYEGGPWRSKLRRGWVVAQSEFLCVLRGLPSRTSRL